MHHKAVGVDYGVCVGLPLNRLARIIEDEKSILDTCDRTETIRGLMKVYRDGGLSVAETIDELLDKHGVVTLFPEASDHGIYHIQIEDPDDHEGMVEVLAIPLVKFILANPESSFKSILGAMLPYFQKYVYAGLELEHLTIFEGMCYEAVETEE